MGVSRADFKWPLGSSKAVGGHIPCDHQSLDGTHKSKNSVRNQLFKIYQLHIR